MKIKDLRTSFVNSLSGLYDSAEILSFFYLLSEEILGLTRVNVAINLDKILSDDEISDFDAAKNRLLHQEPIQYIIGKTDFYGLPFVVSENVLIPRPETEELVDWIIKDRLNSNDPIAILDIGTGSGCIAISLAKKIPEARVYAIDISEPAIKVAEENAKLNKVNVTFIKANILETQDLSIDFDVIVSNPPYVRELEKIEMKSNVLDNEPSRALFVSDDQPLVFYEKITSLAKNKLKKEGSLYFEINQYLGLETKDMIENLGFTSVEIRKDLYGNDRMIKACFD
ncbi:peptide chain release factor N(5)-glutamine methyltransferase [Aquimarina algiphila]|uniref:peptide chain release factor N(5)-glutamine methyltransferase n=1 Tax=Aquimarina algiphila TaxID=2047982 RepID=UPI0023306F3B|nr:peptide chain release factor N(5)-glutamine methyltransferase [Aquimarina algiphila]